MNITATLFAQMLTFAVLVWFVWKFLWDPMTNMMEDRKKRVAEGLESAERGKKDLELAQQKAAEHIRDGKHAASDILAQAQKRANEIIEEAKEQARAEGERIVTAANAEVEQEVNRAREHLRSQLVDISVAGASKVLEKEIDAKAHDDLLKELVAKI